MFGMSLAFIAMTSFIVYNAFTEQYRHVMTIFGIVDPAIKRELVLNDIFIRNGIAIALFFVLFIAAFFYVVFRATHRFFGPLISIERFVGGIIDGDYTQRIVIRRKDELQSLVLRLNEMAATLEKRHGSRVGNVPERRKSSSTPSREVS
jgi:methyl-accepting chemotaxis protein